MVRWGACLAVCFSASVEIKSQLCIPGRICRLIPCFEAWGSRYIEVMFEVLVFVYENYWHGEACPELAHLERKLSSVGFDAEEIQEALTWLDELNLAARGLQQPPCEGQAGSSGSPCPIIHQSPHSMRVYSALEHLYLGAACLGFVIFLEMAGALTPDMRELVIDRAMAAQADPLPLDDLKIIVLMVFWSLGKQPDALVLDELCEETANRVAH